MITLSSSPNRLSVDRDQSYGIFYLGWGWRSGGGGCGLSSGHQPWTPQDAGPGRWRCWLRVLIVQIVCVLGHGEGQQRAKRQRQKSAMSKCPLKKFAHICGRGRRSFGLFNRKNGNAFFFFHFHMDMRIIRNLHLQKYAKQYWAIEKNFEYRRNCGY